MATHLPHFSAAPYPHVPIRFRGAAGYELGTKANRKRYYQLVHTAQAVADAPVTR